MSWSGYHRLQGLIFTGWGLFALDIVLSGKILFYINRRFVILILLTAVVFLGLAEVVLTAPRHQRQEENSDREPEHDHSLEAHAGQRPPVWGLVILALPLILGVIVPSRPLESSVVANRGVNATAPLGRLQNSSTTSVGIASTEKSVLDWVGDFNSGSDPSIYVGQEAIVSGFVYHDARMGPDQFLVGRFVVTCCVADALALGMVVHWPGADKLAANSWVLVKGPVSISNLGGQRLPGIEASQVNAIPSPDQPYLFP
ncbi:MAG TPA: TIGR03943 family protein [Anaerolineaceae bacterium]|nr:TIGR03943 family protein [Anaerolineaceae bacterium]